jgi:hypothetical protein
MVTRPAMVNPRPAGRAAEYARLSVRRRVAMQLPQAEWKGFIIKIKTLFERKVFIRLDWNEAPFICTENWPLFSVTKMVWQRSVWWSGHVGWLDGTAGFRRSRVGEFEGARLGSAFKSVLRNAPARFVNAFVPSGRPVCREAPPLVVWNASFQSLSSFLLCSAVRWAGDSHSCSSAAPLYRSHKVLTP